MAKQPLESNEPALIKYANHIVPFGKYWGTKLKDVPVKYWRLFITQTSYNYKYPLLLLYAYDAICADDIADAEAAQAVYEASLEHKIDEIVSDQAAFSDEQQAELKDMFIQILREIGYV